MRYIDPTGEDLKDFAQGFANALGSNMSFGLGRQSSSNSDFQSGQRTGDVVSMITGTFEMAVGAATTVGGAAGGIVASPTGVGAVVGGAVSVEGIAITAHGYGTAAAGAYNFSKSTPRVKDTYNGPKTGDRISGVGVTKHAADQAKARNVSTSQIENALNKGTRYFDTKNNSDLWVIGERNKGGYSVATTTDKSTLKTVQNFVPNLSSGRGKRFIKY